MEGGFVGIIPAASGAASRAGFSIIRSLVRSRSKATLLFGTDGPLVGLSEESGFSSRVLDAKAFTAAIFRERVDAARDALQELRPAVLYVNSCAASAWAVAGKQLGSKVILHVVELDRQLMTLLHNGATCIDICAAADVVVCSGGAVAASIRRCLGYVPGDLIDIGVFRDGAEISALAKEEARARWLHGRKYARSDRKLVAMWGTASHDIVIDLFLDMAQQSPEHDFLWIGEWTAKADRVSSAKGAQLQDLRNFYCASSNDNPYPLIAMSDLTVLTARDAEQAPDLAELAAIGTPIVCFSEAIDDWKLCPAAFYVLYGTPSAQRLRGFLRSYFEAPRHSPGIGSITLEDPTAQEGLSRLMGSLDQRGLISNSEGLRW